LPLVIPGSVEQARVYNIMGALDGAVLYKEKSWK